MLQNIEQTFQQFENAIDVLLEQFLNLLGILKTRLGKLVT
jgi:hypothetical protein